MFRKEKHYFGILTAAALIFLMSALIGCSKPVEQDTPKTKVEDPPPLEEEVQEAGTAQKKIPPVIVAIDNHSRARPQSGLQQATIVYEFLVEGGITRYVAVFDTLPEEAYIIGPIRSLRPYMAYQALEHGGVLAHGGYSSRTREEIRGLPLTHIISSAYLWRDSSRKAPHNLYTDTEKLLKAAGFDGSFEEIDTFRPRLPEDFAEGLDIEIAYQSSNKVSYTYDQDSAAYLRFINGNPHLDKETKEHIHSRRVILRKTPHASITGTQLLEITLTGAGDGFLYEEGRKYDIKWEKKEGSTRFFYPDGTPLDTTYGNTWIQVVR